MLYGTRLRALSIATALTLMAGFGLAFFYAPMDADQGFMQKIFYVHVPLAIVALCGFVFGGVMGLQHLRTRDSRYDLKSYVAIHLSLILGVGVHHRHGQLDGQWRDCVIFEKLLGEAAEA